MGLSLFNGPSRGKKEEGNVRARRTSGSLKARYRGSRARQRVKIYNETFLVPHRLLSGVKLALISSYRPSATALEIRQLRGEHKAFAFY